LIIKPGMGTKSVLARFEAERQALAMMDRPNIAKVRDPARRTRAGQKSFVVFYEQIIQICTVMRKKAVHKQKLDYPDRASDKVAAR